jgi:hypothetical protein
MIRVPRLSINYGNQSSSKRYRFAYDVSLSGTFAARLSTDNSGADLPYSVLL